MRISHLSQSVSTLGGGISEAIRALAMAQESVGADVSVMSVRDAGGDLAPWPQGEPIWLRHQKLPGMLRLPDLSEKLDKADPDITHVHGLWTWLSVGVPRWAARRKRPAIVSPHGMLDAWALNQSRWKKRIARAAFERQHLESAACLHALCQSEAESIRAYGLENPIAIIPNGIDLPELGNQGARVRSQASGRKILLFLGRIHPKKGLVNTLKAWAEVRGQIPGGGSQQEWTFAIAGWDQGGHEAELKRLCDEYDITYADIPASDFVDPSSSLITDHCSLGTLPTIFFLGPAFGETKDALLRSADAFILPSFSEGLPMSVLEAWAYELPVLMTDHCNLPEGFTNHAAIQIGTDAASIAKGMAGLIRSPTPDRRSLGENGRELVERQFTWRQVAAQMNEVYEWVMGCGTKPGCVI